MIFEFVILFGVVATIITLYVVHGAFTDRIPPYVGLVGGMAGVLLWAFFAWASLDVTIDTFEGAAVTRSYWSLSIIGLVGLLACLAIAVLDGLDVFREEVGV